MENSKRYKVAPIPHRPFHLLNIYQYIIVTCFVKLLQFSLLQLLNSLRAVKNSRSQKRNLFYNFLEGLAST